MDDSGSGDECIHDADRMTGCLTSRHHFAPTVGDSRIYGQQPSFKAQWNLFAQPHFEPTTPVAIVHALDAVPEFGQCHHARKHTIIMAYAQPSDPPTIGARLPPLRDYVGIEQEGHGTALRARSFLRLISMPDSRRGEAAKNSARLPTRFDFRSHSSADTTTAAVRPCLVIVCGPVERACSISSLNRALASATVHWPMLMTSPIRFGQNGHNGHFMQVAGSVSDLPVLPIEAEGRLAEGEAVEMAGDRALERLQLRLGTRLEPAVDAFGIGLQGERPIARPIGAAGVARKRYRAPLLVELDGERVRPVLAELLEVAAGMGCANAARGLEGHRSAQPFDLARRLVEDVGHLVQRLSLHVVAVEAIEQHRAQVLHGPTDGGDVGAPAGGAELRQAREQRLHLFLLRGEL